MPATGHLSLNPWKYFAWLYGHKSSSSYIMRHNSVHPNVITFQYATASYIIHLLFLYIVYVFSTCYYCFFVRKFLASPPSSSTSRSSPSRLRSSSRRLSLFRLNLYIGLRGPRFKSQIQKSFITHSFFANATSNKICSLRCIHRPIKTVLT